MSATKKQLFLVESADEDESQIMEDWVPAEDEEKAKAEVEALRGEYATVCCVMDGRNALRYYKKKVKRLTAALTKKGMPKAQKEWDEFLKEAGDIVRLPNGSVGKLDTEEVDTCRLCGKYYRPDGDSWDGLDPACADKVSAYMDKHGADADVAVFALIQLKGKEGGKRGIPAGIQPTKGKRRGSFRSSRDRT